MSNVPPELLASNPKRRKVALETKVNEDKSMVCVSSLGSTKESEKIVEKAPPLVLRAIAS